MRPWHSLTGKDLPASTRFEVLCSIVRAPEWRNLPEARFNFGWDSKTNTITILNPFALRSFQVGRDPEDFRTLFEIEADAKEREIGDEDRGEADGLLAARLIRAVRLVSTNSFREPDPKTDAVLVHVRIPGTIDSEGDWGSVVPRPSKPPLDKIRKSTNDIVAGRG